ncbi:hypothetical protein GCM10009414_19980 [Tatumella terrea]|uniref:DUF3251 domain-containing protein n=1 Tax=Tatumella terrea TaxID=419007 RepID=UPI0031D4C661
MKKTSLSIIAVSLLLAGCSSSQPPARLTDSVGQLNRDLSRLSAQSEALAYQRQLNAVSTRGAWLLPLADSAVSLVTAQGKVLTKLAPVSPGGLPVLLVKNQQTWSLPPFTITAELATVSDEQGYRNAVPVIVKRQVLQRAVPLAPSEQARFILPEIRLKEGRVLVVNVHQFMPEISAAVTRPR